MPDPESNQDEMPQRLVATHALICGVLIMLLKLGIYFFTNSTAVLSDALESVINIVAAAFLLYSVWLSNRPADREHPYGHGKIEFMVVGLEGWMILSAAVGIAYQALHRLYNQEPPKNLLAGSVMLGAVGMLSGLLAYYVWSKGKKLNSQTLVADGKHLFTDVASTVGVLIGLIIVQKTGWMWLDPIVALIMAGIILWTSWKLLWDGINGLMDRMDLADDMAIRALLDFETKSGTIKGYHKLRHRHSGTFHWVDLHLQVDGAMSVRESHALASAIEHRIEKLLGERLADATAHIEPWEEANTTNEASDMAKAGAADGAAKQNENAAAAPASQEVIGAQPSGKSAFPSDQAELPMGAPMRDSQMGPGYAQRPHWEPDGPIPLDGEDDQSHHGEKKK